MSRKPLKSADPTETVEQYRQRIVEMVCESTKDTEYGIRRICDAFRKDDQTFPPARTIRTWISESEELKAQYACAKEYQIEHMADQILEISDDSSLDMAFNEDGKPFVDHEHIQRSKLRVDSRKWLLSKINPKKYGDKISQEITGKDGAALSINIVKFGE